MIFSTFLKRDIVQIITWFLRIKLKNRIKDIQDIPACSACEYLHLFGQRATLQESPVAIGIAAIERDTNIALESYITALNSGIRWGLDNSVV